jgi:hypothetical protein
MSVVQDLKELTVQAANITMQPSAMRDVTKMERIGKFPVLCR